MDYNNLQEIVAQRLQYPQDLPKNFYKTNLIELGLDSLKLMLIIDDLRKKDIAVSFSEFMSSPYISNWWEILSNKQALLISNTETTIKSYQDKSIFPLTDVQHAYWIGRKNSQPLGGIACHMYFEFICKKLDKERLQKAWQTVQYHHPALRTRFLENGLQEILLSPYSENITVYDFQEAATDKKENKLKEIRKSSSRRLLKIEEGQVVDLSLSIVEEDVNIIHFDVDLLAADLKSIRIILADLSAAYRRQELSGMPSDWSFSRFVENKRNEKSSAFLSAQRYWHKKEKVLPSKPELPYRTVLDHIQTPGFKRRNHILSKEKWHLLKQYASLHQVTAAMVFLTLYFKVLARFSTAKSFLINIPLFDRPSECKNIVSDFTNVVLLPFKDEDTSLSFLQQVEQVQKQFLEVMQYTSYSGIRITRDCLKLNPSEKLIAPVVFSCDYGEPLINTDFENTLGTLHYIASQTPQVVIDFQVIELTQGLMLSWDVVEEAFHENVIEEMFSCYVGNVHDLLADTQNLKKSLPILKPDYFHHRYISTSSFIKNFAENDMQTLHEKIFTNSKSFPSNIALIEAASGKKISYKELVELCGEISTLLRSHNIKQGTRIGVYLGRGVHQIAAVLAILSSGACYVPLGVKQPLNRIRKMLSKAQLSYVLTNTLGVDFFKDESSLNLLNIEVSTDSEICQQIVIPDAQESAYIIFTSGTSGEPKGVEISHACACNTIKEVNAKCCVQKTDKILSVSSLEFDLSVYDIFGILNQGGCIVLLDETIERDASVWLSLINRYKVTLWNSVPFLMDMLIAAAEKEKMVLSSLRQVMLSGDWISLPLPARLKEVAPNAKLIAMGGATEASIWSNFYDVSLPLLRDWPSIPYGQPLPAQLYRVVDKNGQDCPSWVTGELWIGGAGVAKDYTEDELLTEEKFVEFKGMRWYKSGDLGRFRDSGLIEFLGRSDYQIKVKGHRIEIGEIEFVLNKYPQVTHCVVCAIVSETNKKEKRLWAYVVTKKNSKERISEKYFIEKLRDFLKLSLPEYMIPSGYYITDNFPLSNNGKVDRKKIAAILTAHSQQTNLSQDFEQPMGSLERNIATVWKNILQLKEISRNDNFFEIGGDSLKAISLIAKIQELENSSANISIQSLFSFPTIKTFSEEICRIKQSRDQEIEIATI